MIANMKVFDCSLREIGYQTGWNFDKDVVHEICHFAESHFIDYVELGFLHSEQTRPGHGIFAYGGEKIEAVNEALEAFAGSELKISTMLHTYSKPYSTVPPKKDSVIDAIRILTRSLDTEFDELKGNVERFRKLGYEVFINFTSSGANTIELNEKLADYAKKLEVPMVYLADTESIMTTEYVKNAIEIFKGRGLKLGMHLHDKNGTAEALADFSISHGVDGVDVTHMGLGGKWRDGNLTMEYLLKKFKIDLGYENTMIRNKIIEQIIKFAPFSAAE